VQIFDAIIVMASFVLDVVFLDGVTEVSEGDQAAALIMTFLLWRVLRIVNGQRLFARIPPATCLFPLLPRLLTLSVHHSRYQKLPLSFTADSKPTSFANLSHHRLPSDLSAGLSPRTL